MFQLLHLFQFFGLECSHALEHLVEIDLMSVEFRPVDTHEACLASDRHAACSTHARTVDHDGVERYVGRNLIFLGKQAAELHHDSRSDGETLVDLLAQYHLFDAGSHQALLSVTTVVGHDDNLVGVAAHLVFEYDEFFRTSGQHRDDAVAGFLQCLDYWQHRSNPDTTSGTHHGTEALDVSSLTKRTHHIGDVVAHAEAAKLGGAVAHGLYHERDCSFFYIAVGNSKRNAFTLAAGAHNHEMTCAAGTCNEWCFDFESEHFLTKLSLAYNLVHLYK